MIGQTFGYLYSSASCTIVEMTMCCITWMELMTHIMVCQWLVAKPQLEKSEINTCRIQAPIFISTIVSWYIGISIIYLGKELAHVISSDEYVIEISTSVVTQNLGPIVPDVTTNGSTNNKLLCSLFVMLAIWCTNNNNKMNSRDIAQFLEISLAILKTSSG